MINAIYRRFLASALSFRVKRLLGARRAHALRRVFEGWLWREARIKKPHPDKDKAKFLLASFNEEELIQRIQLYSSAFELVPNVEIGPRAAACMRAAIYSEELLPNLSDFGELDRVLKTTTVILRELTQIAPMWSDAHRLLGRNYWFRGKIDDGMRCFGDAERCLPKLAEAAGWDPDARVMLPRNCAQVIGLMGHIDAFVKHKILTGDRRPYHLVAPEDEVVNLTFLDYWKDYVHIDIRPKGEAKPSAEETAYAVNWNWVLPDGKDNVVHVHKGIARIQRQWAKEKRGSLLRLKLVHAEKLEKQKKIWGMKEDEWFVAVHVRSAGFYVEGEGVAQHFRNTSIEDYYPMMRYILKSGGWVVRMGDPTMAKLDLKKIGGARIIDYAHSPDRSEELDVALCASCRLFVSSPSGLHTVAHAFGRPVCYVNVPMYAGYPWSPGSIYAPQRYFSHEKNRVLSLEEILSSNLVFADHHFALQRMGIELKRINPVDILEAVREALDPKGYKIKIDDMKKAVQVRKTFDRLNAKYGRNISGKLSLHFAAKYAEQLCPRKKRK